MMKTVFVVMEENSPELGRQYGACNLIGVYDTWEKALEAVETRLQDNKNSHYLEAGECYFNDEKHEYCNTLYWNGVTDDDYWTTLLIKPTPVQ